VRLHNTLGIAAEVCPNCTRAPIYFGHRCSGVSTPQDPCPCCGKEPDDRTHQEECVDCPLCERCCKDLGRADPEEPPVKVVAWRGTKIQLKNIHCLDFHLRVNGIHYNYVFLSRRYHESSECELVVHDSELGPVTLNDSFEINLRSADELHWHQLPYEEVKETIHAAVLSFGAPKRQIGVEADGASILPDDRVMVTPTLSVLRRVQEILYLAGVPCLFRERTCNRTLAPVAIIVPRVLKSQIFLRRAGFVQDETYTSVLHDPENSLSFELVEKSPLQ
jgi:hypothetical protein